MEFLGLLINSASFWQQTAFYFCLSVFCLALAALLLFLRRQHLTSLTKIFQDRSGAAVAVDFTLTIPIFMVLILFMVQLALLANASLIVHYSAYNAARSARVWLLDDDHAYKELGCCLMQAQAWAQIGLDGLDQLKGQGHEDKVRLAATMPLVSISPGSDRYGPRAPGGPFSSARLNHQFQVITDGDNSRQKMLQRKARYAFTEENTAIEFGFLDNDPNLAAMAVKALQQLGGVPSQPGSITNIPVFGEVTFRYPLLMPIAAAVFNEDDQNPYARFLNAKVKLE